MDGGCVTESVSAWPPRAQWSLGTMHPHARGSCLSRSRLLLRPKHCQHLIRTASEKSFKSYTAGAIPGIWTSNASPADTRLVITESPIDAMSHWEMLPPEDQAVTRYAVIRAGFRNLDGAKCHFMRGTWRDPAYHGGWMMGHDAIYMQGMPCTTAHSRA